MGSPFVIRGISELSFVTTDGSGPNTQEGLYAPWSTSFTLEKTTEVVDIYAFAPVGGTGVKQKVASFQGQNDWSGTLEMNAMSFLELQLVMGQKLQNATKSIPRQYTGTVSSNTIANAALVGVAEADVLVTWASYDATAGSPVQLEVDVSPATASATKVILDPVGGDLTFAAQFEGQAINYTILTSLTKNMIGLSNPTLITELQMFGLMATNGSTTAGGIGVYVPALTLDGNFSVGATGSENTISIPFSPVLASGYSEPVILVEM